MTQTFRKTGGENKNHLEQEMEDDTMDGCVASKVTIDDEVVDEVPSSSQPATQPLGGNQDTTDSEDEDSSSAEEDEIVIVIGLFLAYTISYFFLI